MTRLALLLLVAGCTQPPVSEPDAGSWAWSLPKGFPAPRVPADNPMSDARVQLGRRLFYEQRLSADENMACASCHVQANAFTVPTAKAGGLVHATKRNVIALVAPAYMPTYTWADPSVTSLEQVIGATLVDENEFGAAGREAALVASLEGDPLYGPLFAEAFPAEPLSFGVITKAIACFVRTIVSGDSPFDRFQQGDSTALSPAARRGMDLFFSERTECYHCHSGFTFSNSVTHQGLAVASVVFSNTGLYDLDGQGTYPAADQGLIETTSFPADMGKFKTPSLRNVAKTAPYQHDGSMATLREVLDAYLAGGRSALDGGQPAVLCDSLIVDRLNQGPLTEQEKEDLLAFLDALTDEAFLTDPKYARP